MVTHLIESDDSIPLIDEEFDTFTFDLASCYEWAAVAGDEAWGDYPVVPIGSA